ncbi:FAD-binding oxidoreductase [Pandoraea terrae]|uniref:FAD-binding oxidoreductase n=1 Tax=Pandoraea terrae TaxID=1537710 RepID=A0A5E4S836_9BURK|nr:FAD-dependent oxidoreductase [Pandoraea terrae]VVD70724.1 FAD-binding oxidoreductase [Pandoraea terrae]
MRPFWLEQALIGDTDLAPALCGVKQADICIVGGGFTGLWTALQLKRKRPSLKITVLEADLCGAGASGRNGGCMLTWSTKFFTLARLFGETEAVRLVRASEAAVQSIADFCRQHSIDADLRLDGTLYTATNPAQEGQLEPVIQALQRRNLNTWTRLCVAEVAARSGSARNLSGFFSPMAGTVHPGKLVRGLRRVALREGIEIHERTPMLSLIDAARPAVVTPAGRVEAGHVVLALNAWMPSLFSQFERSVAIVSSDMIMTDRCPERLAAIGMNHGTSVLDSRTFVYYYRTTCDGRLMLGKGGNTFSYRGRIAPVFNQRSPYEAMLTQSLRAFFPSLGDVPVIASWNGPSDRSVTGFPFFGYLNGNRAISYGFGYSGNGVAPSYMGGQLLSSLALGEDNAWTRSGLATGPRGYFPPEPVRYLGSLLVRNAIRRKENAEDRQAEPFMIDRFLARFAAAAGKSDKSG